MGSEDRRLHAERGKALVSARFVNRCTSAAALPGVASSSNGLRPIVQKRCSLLCNGISPSQWQACPTLSKLGKEDENRIGGGG